MVNNQRGGIVSFVVVGVVLAGLLAGALYLSKQQGREARTDTPAPQIAERNTDTQKAPAEKPAEKKENPQTNNETSNGGQSNGSSNDRSTSQTGDQTPGSTDRVANTGPSSDIPSTGPVETVATVIALTGMTFALYRHGSSRRDLRHSALRK